MQRFHDLSIRTKLSLLLVITGGLGLMMACAAFVVIDMRMNRDAKVAQLNVLANVLGSNSKAALDFGDIATAQEILSSLTNQTSIEHASLWTPSDRLFAKYATSKDEPGELLPVAGSRFTPDNHLEIVQVILHDDKTPAGTIYLRANMLDLEEQQTRYLAIALAVVLISLAVSLGVARWLLKLISAPILQLAYATQRVTKNEDYSLRVTKCGNDELGVLVDGFNSMLEQIQRSKVALQQAHDDLERRVEQRTSQLLQAREDAEAASRAKSEFLANMSHEIRTPMTAILGFSDILVGNADDPQTVEASRVIQRNGVYLIGIINDILDLSKIEAGKLTVEKIPCSPSQIVADVASLMRVRAEAKGLPLNVRFDGAIPSTIESDPTRLRQILINLLGNAIKFTETGNVELVVRLLGGSGPSPWLQFEINDTGIGMNPSQLSKLFMPFTQADNSTTRRYGGTGLGLTISKRLSEILGGQITVESEVGRGTTFRMGIMAGNLTGVRLWSNVSEAGDPAPETKQVPANAVSCANCRVLLAEDGPDNQRLISFVLKKAGAQVTLVDNGEAAVTAVLGQLEAGTPFDVVLMDMQMPILDGYSATAKLRARGYNRPIIALTAHAMSGDRDKCMQSGCDDYATKPIDREKLLALVASYSSQGKQVAAVN